MILRKRSQETRRRSATASPFAVLVAAELVETHDDRGIGQRIQDGDVGDVVEVERRPVRPRAPKAEGRGGGEVPQIFVVAVPGCELPGEAWLARISRDERELTGGREARRSASWFIYVNRCHKLENSLGNSSQAVNVFRRSRMTGDFRLKEP